MRYVAGKLQLPAKTGFHRFGKKAPGRHFIFSVLKNITTMKRLILAICFIVAGATFAQAQDGAPRPGGGERMREMMKQRLKEGLQFTDVQVDSVMAVQTGFQTESRTVRMDQNLSDEQKAAKMKELDTARKARLKSFLTDAEITRLDAFYEEMRRSRPNRPQPNQK